MCEVHVVKVDLTESELYLSAEDSEATLSLTGDSYSPGGYVWSSVPAGISSNGPDKSIVFVPSNLPPGKYVVRCASADLADCYDECEVYILKVELVPDWNHDRKIDDQDREQVTAANPFRFWVNDDNDYGDISDGDSDLPGENVGGNFQPDYYTDDVDGRSDLLDFFPLWLYLKQALDLLPPSGTVQYKLRQADSAVNAVYTDLTKGQAGNFLTTEGNTYGPSLNEDSYDADTFEVTSSGVELDEDFLDKIINDENKGVLMIEGAGETTAPLVLEVWKDGAKICETELPLSIAGVEKMYRWINVRGSAGGAVGRPTDTNDEPDNYPDDYCNGKQFVFVHGYSVHEEGARAWNAEIFKRLYQSGSRAMFTAATWYGNEGQVSDWVPFIGGSTPDYYSNVENAFQTASNLVAAISDLPGSKYIAGHSLGNMLVSSAIVDAGLSVNAYIMLNAAVAREAYQGTASNADDMRHPDWQNYSNRLWASEWYRLFGGADGRNALTWRDRFGAIFGAHNYFSSTEDVLDNADGDVPSLGRVQAWVCQEMRKGTTLIWLGPGNAEAGWGFNDDYSGLSVAQANALSNSVLQTNSFCLHFDDEDLYGTNGSAVAQQPATYRQLLADAIPALSNPMGRNQLSGFGSGNVDYMNFRRGTYPSGWPRSENDWRHSDIKNVAYPYNRGIFDEIVGDGGLQ